MKDLNNFKIRGSFILLLSGCLLASLFFIPGCGDSSGNLPLAAIHIERIRELIRLTAPLKEELWPGFDLKKIPLIINYDNRMEVFIFHPNPPAGSRVYREHKVKGKPIILRDGCATFLIKGSGTARTVAGVTSTYMSTLDDSKATNTTEEYLSIALHESFHVYQKEIPYPSGGQPYDEFPIYDSEQAGLLALENLILHEALRQKEKEELHKLAKMFVAVRSQRQGKLSKGMRNSDNFDNFMEGTAMYIQVRLFQLMAKKGGLKSPLVEKDPHYNGFQDSGKLFRRHIDKLLPAGDKPVTLGKHIYENGMGQGFLLDRVRPTWKREMVKTGMSQFEILQRHFPLQEAEAAKLAAESRRRFNYEKLLAQQENLIKKYLETVYGYLKAKGRRYRIFHSHIKARFRWVTRRPYYFIIPGLLNEKDWKSGYVLVYPKGIERFEKGDLEFRAKKVPVIFRGDCLECIDPQPAADFSDMKIKASKQEKEVYYDLDLTCPGFTLKIGRARIERSQDLVDIHPLRRPKQKKQ